MIGLRGRLDARQVTRALAATRRRGPKITAQEMNVQRRQSRTRITRKFRDATRITPVRRIRNRVLLPRAGMARPGRLRTFGLALLQIVPARWFVRGKRAGLTLPAGLRLAETSATTGAPFVAEAPPRGRNVFRRGARPRNRGTADDPTWLPIKEAHVDTAALADRAIEATVAELASEWPGRFAARMQRELDRIWGN